MFFLLSFVVRYYNHSPHHHFVFKQEFFFDMHRWCPSKLNPFEWKMKLDTLHHCRTKSHYVPLLGPHFSSSLLCFCWILLYFFQRFYHQLPDYNSPCLQCCPAFQLSFLKYSSDTSQGPQATHQSKYPVTGNSL